MMSVRRPLADAYWPDVEAGARGVLLVPVGATEQHGPHLPLDTDTFLANAIAGRVNAARPDSGLAPALAFGSSGEHADFPGTLSIGTDVLQSLIVELVRDACRHWFALLIVNGHGGNLTALRRAAEICHLEGRRLGVVHLALDGMDAHAGDAETSMMLHLDPSRVQLSSAEQGNMRPAAELIDDLRSNGVRRVSTNGVLGDPTRATAERGRLWIEALTEKAIAAHDQLATTP